MSQNDVRIQIEIDSKSGEAKIQALGKGIAKIGPEGEKAFGKIETAAKTARKQILSATDRITSMKGAIVSMAAGYSLTQLVDGLWETGKEVARLEKSFDAITGSSAASEKEFEFLRQTADRLGQNFYVLADSYKSITAASKNTAMEGQVTRDIFVGITQASATLGLTTDQTKGALNAIQQMMSKGNVQAEELRGQLGERLPGAFNLAARAMGVSTVELNKMLDSGKVLAEDLLPKLGLLLQKEYSGEVDEATRASNKFDEAWTDLKASMASSGFLDAAAGALGNVSEALADERVKTAVADLGENLGQMISRLAELSTQAPDALEKVQSGITSLYGAYQVIPDEITAAAGYGLAGRLVFGGWGPAKVIAAVSLINDGMAALQTTGITPDDYSLGGLADSYREAADAVNDLFDAMSGKLGPNRAQVFDINETSIVQSFSNTWSAIDRASMAGADAAIEAYNARVKAAEKAAAVEAAAALDSSAQVEESFLTTWHRIDKARMAGADAAIKSYSDQKKAAADAAKDEKKSAKDEKKSAEDAARAAREAAADRLSAYQSMYGDLGTAAEDNFDFQQQLLEEQRDKYAEVTGDQALADQWYTDKYQDLCRDRTLASNDFFGGVKAGWQDSQGDVLTWGQAGYNVVDAFATQSSAALSNILFDGIKGNLGDFSSYWDSMWDSMLRTLTDTIAQMASQQLVKTAVSAAQQVAGAALSGVDYLGSDLLGWWDTGAYDVQQDHVAMVHAGEMIIPAGEASIIRRATGGDADSLATGAPVGGWDGFGDVAAGFFGGTAASFGKRAGAGLGLLGAGQIGFDDFLSGAFSLENIGASVAYGGIPGAINAATGVTGNWGKVGSMLAQALGASALGPAAALLGPLGALIGDAIGDMTDSRGLEGIRDAMEDPSALGYFGGRKAFKDFVTGMGAGGWETEGMTGWGGFRGLGIGNPGSYGGDMADYGGGYGENMGGFGGLGIGNPGSYGGDGGGSSGDNSGSNHDADRGDPWRHGGWADGSESGHVETLHGRELILNQNQVDGVRNLFGSAAPGGRSAGESPNITALLALLSEQADSGAGNEIHVHVHIDGREIASAIAEQYRAGNNELIEQTRRVV